MLFKAFSYYFFNLEEGFCTPKTPVNKSVNKQASSASSCPRSNSPTGRSRSLSPEVKGALHQHLPVSILDVPLSVQRS